MEEVPVHDLQMHNVAMLKEKVHKMMEEGLLRYRGQKLKEA
jgi:hypothetical protein